MLPAPTVFALLAAAPLAILAPPAVARDAAPSPCEDARYLELKRKPLDAMTDREYEYFTRKDVECGGSARTENPAATPAERLRGATSLWPDRRPTTAEAGAGRVELGISAGVGVTVFDDADGLAERDNLATISAPVPMVHVAPYLAGRTQFELGVGFAHLGGGGFSRSSLLTSAGILLNSDPDPGRGGFLGVSGQFAWDSAAVDAFTSSTASQFSAAAALGRRARLAENLYGRVDLRAMRSFRDDDADASWSFGLHLGLSWIGR